MRPVDNPIPPEERLFRSISEDDVDPDGRVTESAVDLQGSSVAREKYCGDVTQLAPVGAGNTGLAVTTPGALPGLVALEGVDTTYEVFAWDVPKEGDDGHAEIRVGRVPDGTSTTSRDHPNNHRPKNGRMKNELKARIAAVLTVFRSPMKTNECVE